MNLELRTHNLTQGRRRYRIALKGRVQGVGFRPAVHRCAMSLDLAGSVRNTPEGVIIEIETHEPGLWEFLALLNQNLPPLARIDSQDIETLNLIGSESFIIEESAPVQESIGVFPADAATCEDCLKEFRNPEDRRANYAFINCTNCGPRFTIIESLPYDRERTTMRDFPMCPECGAEYNNIEDRRYHAEPVACPVCGPSFKLLSPDGEQAADDPLARGIELLRAGYILAIKGIGGYHLACDASNEDAARELRRRKYRPEKPFALMIASLEGIRNVCELNTAEEELLRSPAAPIVLLRRREGVTTLAPSIAPGQSTLGVMLPYAPHHHRIANAFSALVMTSGNLSDEPLISTEEELNTLFGPVADYALIHNRAIAHKCDDSILRVIGNTPVFIRRARGYVPDPLPLPNVFLPLAKGEPEGVNRCVNTPTPPQPLLIKEESKNTLPLAKGEPEGVNRCVITPNHPPTPSLSRRGICILAYGAEIKSTFGFIHQGRAILSQHLGDLDDARSVANFEKELREYLELFKLTPTAVAHDLHPDYRSTRLARELGIEPCFAIQHHHAHLASCLADNGLNEPCIGVIYDGAGYGLDGTIWGGEILVGDASGFERAACWKPIPQPGGDVAVREPWRMAVSHLFQTGIASCWNRAVEFSDGIDVKKAGIVREMLERQLNCPLTSSMGRLFDAFAAWLGLLVEQTFEGQGPMLLESAVDPHILSAFPYRIDHRVRPWIIDPSGIWEWVCANQCQANTLGELAARFHNTIVDATARVCEEIAEETGLRKVVLSGGVFQNACLTEILIRNLLDFELEPILHRHVPPNDGGIAYGQLAIAMKRMAEGKED